ncbi:hypothetical protein MYU51_008711 [Penicillium brevicompactum]
MNDKVFLLTGSSGGIGIETGRALAATEGKVYLGVRDLVKGEQALKEILEPGHVELLELDVVNNAGIMACPEVKTANGFESQFAINYLGHFLLYNLLEQTLLSSYTTEFQSRVVNVSSAGHRMSSVVLDNINLDGEYEAWKAYGNAKTACIWMTNEIERRHGSKGLHGLSLMPGGIFTGLQRHVDPETLKQWGSTQKQTREFQRVLEEDPPSLITTNTRIKFTSDILEPAFEWDRVRRSAAPSPEPLPGNGSHELGGSMLVSPLLQALLQVWGEPHTQ